MKKILGLLIAAVAFVPQFASAHCPLCTAGAGVLAIAATYLGLSSAVVGVLVGAFALALSLWVKNIWPKKKYIRYQGFIVASITFLATVVPIMPLIRDYAPFYIPFWGQYGKTFAVNLFVSGLPVGALIIFLSPYLSRVLSRMRGGVIFPYQGLTITFSLLVLFSALIQFLG